MSFKANIIIEIRDFSSNPDQLLQKEFQWNTVMSFYSLPHPKGSSAIQEDIALISSPISSEGRTFWQLCCK
jgi:hypothetical protein